MSHDYGYFGSDSEGYAHYTDATEEKGKDGGGGSGPKRIGCGTGILIVVVIITFLSAIADGSLFQ
jgi:hypothetical protein